MPDRPTEIEQFISTHIGSVEQLEVLLLLFRSPDTYWGADAISHQLNLPIEIAGSRVRDLRRTGLVREGQTGSVYRFDASDPERVRMVELVAREYREKRIAVINAIYSANLTRLRTFADAFKFGGRKEEKE